MGKQFAKYVSQNILGMMGISFYIIADTYFISAAVGSKGITALNLVLPIYSLIFAVGAMIGTGSAIRFAVDGGRKSTDRDKLFSNALFWGTAIGLIFSAAGFFFPHRVISLMGGDSVICETGSGYTKIFMSFAPFFIWNHICNAFVRNDGAPSVSMAATLSSSLFNIAADYILMFPLGMGMEGAALATAISPLV
ncbi:MAG: MATE family efflux transporter, partial [Huintestinicola sp.]